MEIPDMINAALQLSGAVLTFLNIKRIIEHKEVKGVSTIPVMNWIVRGWWNLYYFPYLGQMISFVAGILVVTANMWWLALMFYYKRKENSG